MNVYWSGSFVCISTTTDIPICIVSFLLPRTLGAELRFNHTLRVLALHVVGYGCVRTPAHAHAYFRVHISSPLILASARPQTCVHIDAM